MACMYCLGIHEDQHELKSTNGDSICFSCAEDFKEDRPEIIEEWLKVDNGGDQTND